MPSTSARTVLVLAVLGLAGCGGGEPDLTVKRSSTTTHGALVVELDAACNAQNSAFQALEPALRAAKDQETIGAAFGQVAAVYRDHVRVVQEIGVPGADVPRFRSYLEAARRVADAAGRFARKAPGASGVSKDAAGVLQADGVRRKAASALGADGCATYR